MCWRIEKGTSWSEDQVMLWNHCVCLPLHLNFVWDISDDEIIPWRLNIICLLEHDIYDFSSFSCFLSLEHCICLWTSYALNYISSHSAFNSRFTFVFLPEGNKICICSDLHMHVWWVRICLHVGKAPGRLPSSCLYAYRLEIYWS